MPPKVPRSPCEQCCTAGQRCRWRASRPVGRVLCTRVKRADGHPSGTAVAGSLVRPTREHRTGRPRTLAQEAEPLVPLPSWPCSGWGLPSRRSHLRRWWSLTPPFHPYRPGPAIGWSVSAVCFLWHCPAGHPGSALPTTLPCGARTFLTAHRAARPPRQLTRHRKDTASPPLRGACPQPPRAAARPARLPGAYGQRNWQMGSVCF